MLSRGIHHAASCSARSRRQMSGARLPGTGAAICNVRARLVREVLMDSAIHDGAECMSVHAVAGLTKFFWPLGRAGFSPCLGRGLPGQLDGLLRTALPGKTVTGQDPASLTGSIFSSEARARS